MLGFFPDIVLFWVAAIGLTFAVFGKYRRALYLITPAILRWLVWPAIAPAIRTLFERVTTLELIATVPLAGVLVAFAAIKAAQIFIAGIYGNYVSVRVTSSALIATFRIIGRALAWLFFWPIKAFKRRRNMDDLLRHWRRH